jgi:hypothetical protein
MITEFVTFALPKGMTREKLVENYKQTAPKWRQNPRSYSEELSVRPS